MPYKVVPFKADIIRGENASKAAAQLEALIGTHASQGWQFHGLETLQTTVVTPAVPGTSGCLGFGATQGTPERRSNAESYVAVFQRD